MPIYEFGYRPLSEETPRKSSSWIAISLSAIQINWKSKIARRLIIGAWAPLLYFGLVFFAVSKVTETGALEKGSFSYGMVSSIVGKAAALQLADNPESLRDPIWTILFYYQLRVQILAIILMLAIVGPGLISDDLRTKAFPLYFAKAVSRWSYLVGKFTAAAFYVATVSLFPAIFLYIISILFSPDLGTLQQTLPVLLNLLPVYLVIISFCSCLILALSALTWSRRYLGFAWISLWILTEAFSGLLGTIDQIDLTRQNAENESEEIVILDSSWSGSISLRKNCLAVGHRILNMEQKIQSILALLQSAPHKQFSSIQLQKGFSKTPSPPPDLGIERFERILRNLENSQSVARSAGILAFFAALSSLFLWRRIGREERGS
ncbi:MAG: hypothetical protein QF752_08415 [Planctomycetota bacterium]|jgi:ABC-type transport system involved in multi-copper enzyme maturation permease subunit|nr:hypothetical protein [Planctomycetota bacterium]